MYIEGLSIIHRCIAKLGRFHGQQKSEVVIFEKIFIKTHHHTNPLWRVYRLVKFSKVFKNVIIIEFSKFIPSMVLKRHIYKQLLNINIGNQSSIAYKVMLDIFTQN